jgi:hypothetical protein
MSLVFIRLILKPLIHLISVQILRLFQHPCPTLVLLPLLMLHLLHIIDNMVDLSILLGLLPFFLHGRSTICTTVPLTSVVMQSDLRYLLLRCRTPVSSFPCYSNRYPQSWLAVQQHSQNIISCCSNCTCQVCHHCKRPPHAGYGLLSSLH